MEMNLEGIGHKYRKIIRNTFEKALEVTDNNEERIVVTVAFAKKNRIKELNNLYRKVDRETDVLSFPMLDIVYPQSVKDFKEEYAPDGSLYLGDIVICPKIAKKQAKQYGHSKKREIGFLALHGFLHILGYDHIESEDEKVMMETSERVLNEMELKRD